MVDFLCTEDNNSVDNEEQSSEYFYDVSTSSMLKGKDTLWNFSFRAFHEMQFQGHFMKYEILSWNTFTSLSKIHRVMFLFNKKIVKDIVKRSQRRYSVKFSRKGTM